MEVGGEGGGEGREGLVERCAGRDTHVGESKNLDRQSYLQKVLHKKTFEPLFPCHDG